MPNTKCSEIFQLTVGAGRKLDVYWARRSVGSFCRILRGDREFLQTVSDAESPNYVVETASGFAGGLTRRRTGQFRLTLVFGHPPVRSAWTLEFVNDASVTRMRTIRNRDQPQL